jgi:hypothetical protein
MSITRTSLSTFTASLILASTAAASGPVPPDDSMLPITPNIGDFWGAAVAFGDNFIVVGAPSNDDINPDAGSISVLFFDPATGVLTATVIEAPPSLSANAGFGHKLAASGNKIAVAAAGQRNDAGITVGAVYIYEAGSSFITLEETLQPSALWWDHLFAHDVDIQDDRVIVGAPGPGGGNGTGCVWVFDNISGDDWSAGEQLFDVTAEGGNSLGVSVAINQNNNDYFAASALIADVSVLGDEAGQVVVFEYSVPFATWAPAAYLNQTLLPMGDTTFHLGNDIDFDGTTLVAAEVEYDGSTGRAHLFTNNGTWQHAQTLDITSAATLPSFGSSVALRDDLLAIGAIGESFGLAYEGAVYLYHANSSGSWNAIAELQSNGGNYGYLGYSVALSDNGLIAGAPSATEAAAAPIIGHGNVQYWSTSQTPGCHSDVNMDGIADGNDLMDLLSAWGTCGAPDGCSEDVNADGDINMLDLIELLSNWGSCF